MDEYTQKSIEAYNKKAHDYKNSRDYKGTKKLKYDFIDYLSKQDINNKNVLDVACGMGDLLNELYERHSIIGTGIDIAENMIQEATKLYGNHLKFINTNAENILVENDTKDVVTICCAFHHIVNPEKVLSEINRVLHIGGYLYIADFGYSPRLNKMCNKLYSLVNIAGDVKVYDKSELETFCSNTGFSIIEYDRINKISYIAKLQKIHD